MLLFLGAGLALADPFSVGDFVSPGPLATPHAHLSGITQCTECHTLGEGVSPKRCMSCHDEVKEQVDTETGFHKGKGDRCAVCHPDHRGGDFPMVRLDAEHFNHGDETGFVLDGGHATLECLDCHEKGRWATLDQECAACHDDPHLETKDAHELAACDACHGTRNWKVETVRASVLDHTDPKQVDYVLEGAHRDQDCLECHWDAIFAPVKHDKCLDCHDDPHRAPLSDRCEDCHTVNDWFVGEFDHDLTPYPLVGQHSVQPCESCHGHSVKKRLKYEVCQDCHGHPHNKQFDPDPCETCHSLELADFALVDTFDHDEVGWALRGEHTEVECTECHGSGKKAKYRGLDHEDCDSCHEDVHDGHFEPTNCMVCHTESGWHEGQDDFDHDRTRFPLVGEHSDVECKECHPDEQWSGIPFASCEDCHDEHPHADLFEPARCEECHDPVGFETISFAHATETKFDLAPQHLEQTCKSCHEQLDHFEGLSMECLDCHAETHPPGHYKGSCEECHQEAKWTPAVLGDLDHAVTGFALTGAHAQVTCTECHGPAGTPYGSVSQACYGCHADDDIHRNLLGANCESCHTPVAWFRTRFRHHQTGWPLRGAHRLAACVDCHAVSYTGTPRECRACHQAAAPLDVPAHNSAFFPNCEQCHRPFTWALATGNLR